MPRFIGKIENIIWDFNPSSIYFEGYALIEGNNICRSSEIKKSIIISNGYKKFFIPLNNTARHDITEKLGNGKYNYDYAGFEGFIDLEVVNDMKSISKGQWFINIYIYSKGEDIEGKIIYEKDTRNLKEKVLRGTVSKKANVVSLEKNQDNYIILSVKENSSIDYGIKKYNNKKNKETQTLKAKGSTFIFNNMYKIIRLLKVHDNRVAFLSDSRTEFTGNFEFIYKELVSRGGYDIKYILKPSISSKRTLKDKINLLYYISTSKFILLDDYYPQIYKYKIKDNIEVIQLWHAAGAFKTFGFSRLGKSGGPNIRSKKHRNYTKAIVSSDSIKKYYAEAFGISEHKVIATGVPRTDIFFDNEYKEKRTEELYSKYPVLKQKKVIMFAPTFRGDGQKGAYYDFNKLDIDKMYRELSNDYIMMMKLHPFIQNIPKIDGKYKDFIIDLSFEREINDLLFVSDILITDYSSVCFEYSLLNRPMIFFAYDLEEYIETRDFYYPYESFVPGPIARTTGDIINIIKSEKYEKEKLDKFRSRFFNHFDGKSTQRVVNTLLKINNK